MLKINRSRYKEFLKYLGENPKYFELFLECYGGAWYISAKNISKVYSKPYGTSGISGLSRLVPNLNPEEVGEYFCDLVIQGNNVHRISTKFRYCLQ